MGLLNGTWFRKNGRGFIRKKSIESDELTKVSDQYIDDYSDLLDKKGVKTVKKTWVEGEKVRMLVRPKTSLERKAENYGKLLAMAIYPKSTSEAIFATLSIGFLAYLEGKYSTNHQLKSVTSRQGKLLQIKGDFS